MLDHSGMDHGGMNHGDMDMSPQCSMNMLLTTSTHNLCILVPQWRITSTWSLLRALVLIIFLGMSFEFIRACARRYECGSLALFSKGMLRRHGASGSEYDALARTGSDLEYLRATTAGTTTTMRRGRRGVLALLYGLQVGISFMLMLIFMTYNVQVMAAVVVGSVLGYYVFHGDDAGLDKGMACH